MNLDYAILKLEYKTSNFDFAKAVEYATKIKEEQTKANSNIPRDLQVSAKSTSAKTKRIEFFVEVTSEQARAIQTFFKENNIKYGAI